MIVNNKVIAMIEKNYNVQNISLSDSLYDLGIDSLGIVTLIVDFEEEFHILFSDSELDPSRLMTVKDLATLIEKYID